MTLSADQTAWADDHTTNEDGRCEVRIFGRVTNWEETDDGRVRFLVDSGEWVDEDGTMTFHADGAKASFIGTPPRSAEEIQAERDAADAAAREEARVTEQRSREADAARLGDALTAAGFDAEQVDKAKAAFIGDNPAD